MPGVAEQILELARWAPSGDNRQPWRFEIVSEDRINIHVHDTSDDDVYDFDAIPSRLTFGVLLETLRIAASSQGRTVAWVYRELGNHKHLLEVSLTKSGSVTPDPLLPFIVSRSVERRPYRAKALTAHQKARLSESLPGEVEIRWFESFSERASIARLNSIATQIRLSIPEAYAVHQAILDWDNENSPYGVPARAVGVDPMTLRLMRWVMRDWRRTDFMNRYLGGTLIPRIELDWLPGLCCAAHFALFIKPAPLGEIETPAVLQAGQAIQRFWLTATELGLVLQPGLAPVAFAQYGRLHQAFTQHRRAEQLSEQLNARLTEVMGQQAVSRLFFMGRIGQPRHSAGGSRSLRLPLADLLIRSEANSGI